MFFPNMTSLEKIALFSKIRVFPKHDVIGEVHAFFSNSRVLSKTRTFHKYMVFKTLSITSRYKMPLEDYREHFEGWLKDLKKTGGYWPIVERHEYNWSNIYSDLNRLFKDEVWNHVLEQRARERDQYNDRVSIMPSAQTFHGRMPVKSTENIAKSTERRTDHISLF